MQALVFAGLLLWLMNARSRGVMYQIPGALPLGLFLLYIAFQCIPLPPALLRAIAPHNASIYGNTLWAMQPDAWAPLSLHPKATVSEFLRVASYAAMYMLTIGLLVEGKRLKQTVNIVAFFASAVAALALIQRPITTDHVLFFRKITEGSSMGPYVNKNHFAGLMGMLLPLLVALYFANKPRTSYGSAKERIAESVSTGRKKLQWALLAGSVLIVSSVVLSLSRSGVAFMALSMVLLGLLVIRKNTYNGLMVALFFAAFLALVLVFGQGALVDRFEELSPEDEGPENSRFLFWAETRALIKDFPLWGTGMGTYLDAYNIHGTLTKKILHHAHNDYLELLCTAGLVGFMLLAWAAVEALYKSIKAWRKRKDNYAIYMGIGAFSGLAYISMHSFTDFNLQLGANGLYFAFLMGLAVSATHTRTKAGGMSTRLETAPSWIATPLAAAVLVMLISTILFNTGQVIAARKFKSIESMALSSTMPAEELLMVTSAASTASALDPLEAKYAYAKANADVLMMDLKNAERHYATTVRLRPLMGEYLQRSGLVLSYYYHKDAQAQSLLKASTLYNQAFPEFHLKYTRWLFSKGRVQEALGASAVGMQTCPTQAKDFILLLMENGLSDQEVLALLPKRMKPLLDFAEVLLTHKNQKLAEEMFSQALQVAKDDPTVRPSYFIAPSIYYLNANKPDQALTAIRQGVERYPKHPSLRYRMGNVYARMGILERAKEEYRAALAQDPKHEKARAALGNLK